jgi:hypothetical protein
MAYLQFHYFPERNKNLLFDCNLYHIVFHYMSTATFQKKSHTCTYKHTKLLPTIILFKAINMFLIIYNVQVWDLSSECLRTGVFWGPGLFVTWNTIIHKENPTRCNSVPKFYLIFIWSSTHFARHTAHHQEPKTALAASGFAYVEGCWTLSASSNYTSNNPPCMQNQRLLVQF